MFALGADGVKKLNCDLPYTEGSQYIMSEIDGGEKKEQYKFVT